MYTYIYSVVTMYNCINILHWLLLYSDTVTLTKFTLYVGFTSSRMSFDLVYKEIGDLGLYQIYVLFLGWVTCIYGGFIFLTSVFLLYVPDHR